MYFVKAKVCVTSKLVVWTKSYNACNYAGFQIFFTVVLIVIIRLLIFLGPSLMSLALSIGTGQKLDLTEAAADLKAVGTGLLGLGEVGLVLEAVVLDFTAAEV
jgi:hypothetical protein